MSFLQKCNVDEKYFKFLNDNSILLIFHYSNMNTQEWSTIQTKLQKIEPNASLLLMNNNNIRLVLHKTNNKDLISFCQGPTLIIGCHSIRTLTKLFEVLKNIAHVTFLGGSLNKKTLNHLDFSKTLELNNSIQYEFINMSSNSLKPILNFKNKLPFYLSNIK